MIHIKNGKLRMEGSPMELLGEATTGLRRAATGFYAVSYRVENDEAKARDMTERVMEAAFREVREGAFEEIDILEIEDKSCSVPEL